MFKVRTHAGQVTTFNAPGAALVALVRDRGATLVGGDPLAVLGCAVAAFRDPIPALEERDGEEDHDEAPDRGRGWGR